MSLNNVMSRTCGKALSRQWCVLCNSHCEYECQMLRRVWIKPFDCSCLLSFLDNSLVCSLIPSWQGNSKFVFIYDLEQLSEVSLTIRYPTAFCTKMTRTRVALVLWIELQEYVWTTYCRFPYFLTVGCLRLRADGRVSECAGWRSGVWECGL